MCYKTDNTKFTTYCEGEGTTSTAFSPTLPKVGGGTLIYK